jgi:hypothetical protein
MTRLTRWSLHGFDQSRPLDMRCPFLISLLVSQATGECIGKTQNRMSDKPFVRCERELCGMVFETFVDPIILIAYIKTSSSSGR